MEVKLMILNPLVTTDFRFVVSVLEYPAASIIMLEDVGALSAHDIYCYSVKKRS